MCLKLLNEDFYNLWSSEFKFAILKVFQKLKHVKQVKKKASKTLFEIFIFETEK